MYLGDTDDLTGGCNPEEKRVDFNFRGVGLELVIVKSGGGSVIPSFVVEAVYHNGVDMTEAMSEMVDIIDDHYNEVVRSEFMTSQAEAMPKKRRII